MGKYEREKVFIAETIVNDLLNGRPIDSERRAHEFFEYASAFAKRIRNDFPTLQKSEHIGNVYGTSIGDIKLTLGNGKEIFLELKFLKGGVGTRANIGQDSLTDLNLFKGGSVLSWSEFRETKGHYQWVRNELDRLGEYPTSIQNIKSKRAIYEKASYLKQVLGITRENCEMVADDVLNNPTSPPSQLLAANIVKRIIVRDRQEKREYINYLKILGQNHDNIKKFLFLILAGAHTYDSLKAQWGIDLIAILNTLRHKYYVYYIYKGSLDIDVEDCSQKLRNLLDAKTFISFQEEQTNVLICFKGESGNKIPILRIVFHWKNKFQGIETPCLNIFDGPYLLS